MVSKRADAPYRGGTSNPSLKTKCYDESGYKVTGVLRDPGKPLVARMVTPDTERRYVGGVFVALRIAPWPCIG